MVRHEEIGRQIRSLASQFRNWITADGSAGPTGKGGFKAEAGRYHLYVSLACPWAHRTLIFRKLKGLEDMISVDVVSPLMYDKGWVFDAEPARCNDRPAVRLRRAADIYLKADPNYSGRVTVPSCGTSRPNTIVSNESSEIIRMFNEAFDGIGANRAITTRKRCAKRSMRSMSASMTR
jgi:putative glutathione S-transferase